MKLQRPITIIAFLLALVMLFAACNTAAPQPQPTESETQGTEAPTSKPTEKPTENPTEKPTEKPNNGEACVEHDYEEVSRLDAMALRDGEIKYVCSACKDEKTEVIPATKSIKILALGNSFTDDSLAHLWKICKDGGVENVIVANLFKGNCSLDTHWSNLSNNTAAYTYKKNATGSFVNTSGTKAIDGIKDEEWDFIILHQRGTDIGFANTYTKLDNIIDYINKNKTNPDAKIVWHMAWAYQSNSTNSAFSKYDKNQMKMYNEIVARVKELVLTRDDISEVIPSGTAIQNLRTSYIGDTTSRDSSDHLTYGFGRYTAGLMWYAVLTGGSVDVIDWTPSNYSEVLTYLPVIKESVKNAMAKNFEVTQSLFTNGTSSGGSNDVIDPSEVLDAVNFIEADRALAALNGYDIDDYELLEWDYEENAYWHCTQRTTYSHPKSGSTYQQNICTDKKYSTADELPAGTVFICDAGWRYLLEIFPDEDEIYTGTRHKGTTESFYILTEEFLDGCKYIAWDVSSYPKTNISEIYHQAAVHIRVYVPKA